MPVMKKNAIIYFLITSSQGYKCPHNYNPADFYIQKLAIAPSNKESCLKQMTQICDAFEHSSPKSAMLSEINDSGNLNQGNKNQESNLINFKEEIK